MHVGLIAQFTEEDTLSPLESIQTLSFNCQRSISHQMFQIAATMPLALAFISPVHMFRPSHCSLR